MDAVLCSSLTKTLPQAEMRELVKHIIVNLINWRYYQV